MTDPEPSPGTGSPGLGGAGWLVWIVLATIYVALRLAMNREFEGATWQMLVELRAPLPYGHRVLVPLLSRPLVALGLPVRACFAIFEWLATIGLGLASFRTFALRLPVRAATMFSVAILFVLPFAYLLDHRWPIFYPWDTPGMAVVVAGIGLALAGRAGWALVLTGVGALNRETAALVPVIWVLCRIHRPELRRRTLAWAGLMLVLFVAIREGIAASLSDLPGGAIRWVLDGEYRVFSNLRWLSDPRHALSFVGALGMLPVLWIFLHRRMPPELQRLHLVALAGLGGLLLVANAYEPRAFGEIIVVGYVAVAVGLWSWLTGESAPPPVVDRWTAVLDRYGALGVVALWGAVVLGLWLNPP